MWPVAWSNAEEAIKWQRMTHFIFTENQNRFKATKTVVTAKSGQPKASVCVEPSLTYDCTRPKIIVFCPELQPTIKLKHLPLCSGQAEPKSPESDEKNWGIRDTCWLQDDHIALTAKVANNGNDIEANRANVVKGGATVRRQRVAWRPVWRMVLALKGLSLHKTSSKWLRTYRGRNYHLNKLALIDLVRFRQSITSAGGNDQWSFKAPLPPIRQRWHYHL